MKCYCDLMFFSRLCSSSKGLKFMQRIEVYNIKIEQTAKNYWKFDRQYKIAKICATPKKECKNFPTQENWIWPNLEPKKTRGSSLSTFSYLPIPPWGMPRDIPQQTVREMFSGTSQGMSLLFSSFFFYSKLNAYCCKY